jgi:hypothetical protein
MARLTDHVLVMTNNDLTPAERGQTSLREIKKEHDLLLIFCNVWNNERSFFVT